MGVKKQNSISADNLTALLLRVQAGITRSSAARNTTELE
jgi:hypothetical protein